MLHSYNRVLSEKDSIVRNFELMPKEGCLYILLWAGRGV